MPSPVGHTLAGLSLAWLATRPIRMPRPLLLQTAVVTAISLAPDLDLLWGRHSQESHSIGAALIVAAAAVWWRWPVGAQTRAGTFALVALILTLHPVMDAFAVDNAEPLGVMLLWPFSGAYVHSPVSIFDPISRDWGSPGIWAHNFTAAFHELLKVGPVALLVWWRRQRQGNSRINELTS